MHQKDERQADDDYDATIAKVATNTSQTRSAMALTWFAIVTVAMARVGSTTITDVD
jgi:hypothetical protein